MRDLIHVGHARTRYEYAAQSTKDAIDRAYAAARAILNDAGLPTANDDRAEEFIGAILMLLYIQTKREGIAMHVTYRLTVKYKDGTGHTYTELTRKRVAELTASVMRTQYTRPESVTVTTVRQFLAK